MAPCTHPGTVREVNEASRPHTFGRPCSSDENNTENLAAPKTHQPQDAFVLVLETPSGPASCYEHQMRYVRNGDCATHRAATHLPAGIDRVRIHALISLLRMSAGVLCFASNGDWSWTMCCRAVEAWKIIEVAWWGRRSDWLGLEKYSYWSTDAMNLRWQDNKW